jgi:hypothetical protein
MGKKKKKVLNIDAPSKGPTRRQINLTNENPYKHNEPQSLNDSCIPEEIPSEELNDVSPPGRKFDDRPLETEERGLNVS